MRLSKSNAQKLTNLVWRERLRKIAIGVTVVAVLVGGVVAITDYRLRHADPTLDVHPVNATVLRRDTTRKGRSGFIFHAHLTDGRDVDAFAASGFAPPVGERVILGEARHKSGRLTYDLIRQIE